MDLERDRTTSSMSFGNMAGQLAKSVRSAVIEELVKQQLPDTLLQFLLL